MKTENDVPEMGWGKALLGFAVLMCGPLLAALLTILLIITVVWDSFFFLYHRMAAKWYDFRIWLLLVRVYGFCHRQERNEAREWFRRYVELREHFKKEVQSGANAFGNNERP